MDAFWKLNKMPAMSGSFEGIRLLVFFVLLCYCVFLTQGKAKIPSVDDCKKMPHYLECRNRGLKHIPLDVAKYGKRYVM